MPTFELITSTTLNSATSQITISSIPNTFTDLLIKSWFRSANTSTQMIAYSIRFNNETGTATSLFVRANSDGTPVTDKTQNNVAVTTAGGEHVMVTAFPMSGLGMTQNEMYITNYASSANDKCYFQYNGAISNVNTGSNASQVFGWYQDTTAISRLDYIAQTGESFDTGSRVFVYGIKN